MSQNEPPFDRPETPLEMENGKLPPVFNVREVVNQVWGQYQKAISGENLAPGLSTGILQLDRMLGGLMPGLHMLASRPSMGKTTLMLNIVEHLSVGQKVPCLIFSGALSAYEIVRRMAFSRARQSPIVQPNAAKVPDESEQRELKNAASEIAESPLYIEDSFGFYIESLRSIAQRYKRDADIGFIAVDHLHLLRSKFMRSSLSAEREAVEITFQLKSLAREIDIPVLLLADLSRKPEYRSGDQLGVPRMTDLRYSNMTVEFADTIALLYRAQYYALSEEEHAALLGKAELILCKSPAINTGSVELHFNSELLRFEETEPGI